jgi:ABC-type bacteriocin/lantibiotic exporter with double-glycine peptidase domain
MVFVQQEDDYSCGIACLAMVSGLSFSEVFSRCKSFFASEHGIGSRELDVSLRHLKISYSRKLYPHFPKTCLYIMTVPSLNIVAGNHFVVVDLRDAVWTVYDPQRGREGKKFYAETIKSQDGIQISGYSEVVQILGPKL